MPRGLERYGAAGNRYVQQFEKTHVYENFLRELVALASPVTRMDASFSKPSRAAGKPARKSER